MSNEAKAVLSDKTVNMAITGASVEEAKSTGDVKSMDYHRQLLHSKLNEDGSSQMYISPSDNIMSPCTAKLSGLKKKHFMKAKPQSLFGKKSSMSTGGDSFPSAGSKASSSLDGESVGSSVSSPE